jgi:hypothetical protein
MSEQAQFRLALERLEKAQQEIRKNTLATQEIEKLSFLIEIVKEQITKKPTPDLEKHVPNKTGEA